MHWSELVQLSLLTGLAARLRPTLFGNFSEEPIRVSPANGPHESVHVCCRFRAKVDVIGVLIHIEGENGCAAGKGMTVVRCPLIDELAIARQPRQQHPARAAAERFAHGSEFGSPALI